MTLYRDYPELYDLIYGTSDIETEKTLEFINWVLKYTKIQKGALDDKILDLGSGTGRILIPLTEQGFSIEGLEPFEEMSAIALIKAQEQKVNISVTKGSFQTLSAENEFKLILSINGTMAYLYTAEDFINAFKNIYQALKENGYFLLDIMNFFGLIKKYKQPELQTFDIGTSKGIYMLTHDVDLDKSLWKHNSHIYIEKEDKKITKYNDEHILSMVSARELILYAKLANLKLVEQLQSYTDRPDKRVIGLRIILLFQKT